MAKSIAELTAQVEKQNTDHAAALENIAADIAKIKAAVAAQDTTALAAAIEAGETHVKAAQDLAAENE